MDNKHIQAQMDKLHVEHQSIRDRLAQVEAAVSAIPDMDKKLDSISLTLSKYHGFMGGVMFLLTGVAIFIKGGWEVFKEWFK